MAATTADNLTTPNERAISGAMALATHALFFLLLVFGVAWQKRQPEAVVVDLWNSLPPVAVPKPEPAPQVKPEPAPPKPEPKVEAKPVPKPETKPAPKPEAKPPVKPDIALKDKKEKERKAAEQAALVEKKKREQEEALRRLAQQQVREAEAKQQKAAREQEDALKKLAQQQAAAQSKLIDEYKRRIAEKIRRSIIEPPNLQGNPEVEMDVVLLPGGDVLSVKTRKASGAVAWDNAVERAIQKAQPLPLPPDAAMFKDFRELNLKFRPKE